MSATQLPSLITDADTLAKYPRESELINAIINRLRGNMSLQTIYGRTDQPQSAGAVNRKWDVYAGELNITHQNYVSIIGVNGGEYLVDGPMKLLIFGTVSRNGTSLSTPTSVSVNTGDIISYGSDASFFQVGV